MRFLPLEKGGSERKFYRICAGGESPVILVKYSGQKQENRHYVEIAKFLAASNVNVPAIYFHDASEGLIWMQDLGDEDLWSWREAPWERRRPLYESALFEVSKLHIAATRESCELRPAARARVQRTTLSLGAAVFFRQLFARAFWFEESAVRRYAELPVMHEHRRAPCFVAAQCLFTATSNRRTFSFTMTPRG